MIKNLTHRYGEYMSLTRRDVLRMNRGFHIAEFNRLSKQSLEHLKAVCEDDRNIELERIVRCGKRLR